MTAYKPRSSSQATEVYDCLQAISDQQRGMCGEWVENGVCAPTCAQGTVMSSVLDSIDTARLLESTQPRTTATWHHHSTLDSVYARLHSSALVVGSNTNAKVCYVILTLVI
jgi:hypothetical protein